LTRPSLVLLACALAGCGSNSDSGATSRVINDGENRAAGGDTVAKEAGASASRDRAAAIEADAGPGVGEADAQARPVITPDQGPGAPPDQDFDEVEREQDALDADDSVTDESLVPEREGDQLPPINDEPADTTEVPAAPLDGGAPAEPEGMATVGERRWVIITGNNGRLLDALAPGERNYPMTVAWSVSANLPAVSPDRTRLAITLGEGLGVLELAAPDREPQPADLPSGTPQILTWNADGLLVLVASQLYRLDHDGSNPQLLASGLPSSLTLPNVSPMGSYLLYSVSQDSAFPVSWVNTDGSTSTPTQLTVSEQAPALSLTWSENEQWAALGIVQDGVNGIYAWSPLSSSETPILVGAPGVYSPYFGFSPEGARLLLHTNGELWMRNLDVAGQAPFVIDAVDATPAEWSRAGDFISYGTGADGGFITPIATDGTPGTPLGVPGLYFGCARHWTADDSRFYYRACENDDSGPLRVAEVLDTDPPSAVVTELAESSSQNYTVWNDRCLLQWSQTEFHVGSLTSPTDATTFQRPPTMVNPNWAVDGSAITWTDGPSDTRSAHWLAVDPDTCASVGEPVTLVPPSDIGQSLFVEL
jgi:hypothetical protein